MHFFCLPCSFFSSSNFMRRVFTGISPQLKITIKQKLAHLSNIWSLWAGWLSSSHFRPCTILLLPDSSLGNEIRPPPSKQSRGSFDRFHIAPSALPLSFSNVRLSAKDYAIQRRAIIHMLVNGRGTTIIIYTRYNRLRGELKFQSVCPGCSVQNGLYSRIEVTAIFLSLS